MSSPKKEKLKRYWLGPIPILQHIAKRMGFRKILKAHIHAHRNERFEAVDTLLCLIYNLACGRQPIYELAQWMSQMQPRMFGHEHFSENMFNDDRFGRALDKLHQTDRASLMTQLVLEVVRTNDLDLQRLHNDSTTLKAYGKIGARTHTGFFLAKGHSKDHRPDLKQLVFCLTISADGAVPVHFKPYPGNRTDDTTHIETWKTLQTITRTKDFLYVADSKLCTRKQLDFIVLHKGRALTMIPNTWKEVQQFKAQMRERKKGKKRIWRRKRPGDDSLFETFSTFIGTYETHDQKYRIHWIHSSEKKKRDRNKREEALRKTDKLLGELIGKINQRNLKTHQQIQNAVTKILDSTGTAVFYQISIESEKKQVRVQITRGRPGKKTKYKTVTCERYRLLFARNLDVIRKESHIDGIFPLLCTDKRLSAKKVLQAYKYQPRLEKRFTQFKSIHRASPLLFKKIERVEAIMFVFFMAMILQAVIERTVRKSMKDNHIGSLPIYPEHRLAEHPTTAIIFDRFEQVYQYQLQDKDDAIREFQDELSDKQLQILDLLGIKEDQYWA